MSSHRRLADPPLLNCRTGFSVGAIICFVFGQLFEFVFGTYICQGSGRRVDGVVFQTTLSLAAMVLLYVQWMRVPVPPRPDPARENFIPLQGPGLYKPLP